MMYIPCLAYCEGMNSGRFKEIYSVTSLEIQRNEKNEDANLEVNLFADRKEGQLPLTMLLLFPIGYLSNNIFTLSL